MSRATTRKAFEHADRLDPTLSVDDLSEFLPAPSGSDVDPTLAVSALEEFFSEERTAPPAMNEIAGTPILPGYEAGLDAGGVGDYFRGIEDAPAVADDGRVAQDQDDVDDDFEVFDVAAENPGFQSEIQRAAMDFQRFAEKFHAFASQCQQRRAAF